MARPIKQGIDYFSFDTDFFFDNNICALRGKYGADGIAVFLYILTEVYRDKGYYSIFDEEAQEVAASRLGMSCEKIGQITHYLCKRSLLDDKLFASVKVVTSHGIQMRYQEAVKTRAIKTPITVDQRFWILPKGETQGYVRVMDFSSYSEKNVGYSEKNKGFSLEKFPKEKESKEKKIKVNERKEKDFARDAKLDTDNSEPKQTAEVNNRDVMKALDYYRKYISEPGAEAALGLTQRLKDGMAIEDIFARLEFTGREHDSPTWDTVKEILNE